MDSVPDPDRIRSSLRKGQEETHLGDESEQVILRAESNELCYYSRRISDCCDSCCFDFLISVVIRMPFLLHRAIIRIYIYV